MTRLFLVSPNLRWWFMVRPEQVLALKCVSPHSIISPN